MSQPIDLGDLGVTALEARTHLARLEAERALALHSALGSNEAYMSDLEAERDFTREAYVVLGVTEMATLRAELWGPQSG
jgi:hypothetical protein